MVCQSTNDQSLQQSPYGAVRSSWVGPLCAKPQVGNRDRFGTSQEDIENGEAVVG
jgi:hypothetical protein